MRPSKTGERAVCPACDGDVVSRCGEINAWHWAHRVIAGCDTWIETETEWHSGWKNLVPETWIEIIIEKDGKRRLADIRLPNGCAVKLQRAPLSPEEIRDYEQFFGEMVWIFDVRDSRETLDALGLPRLDLRKKEMSPLAKQLRGGRGTPANYRTFRWKHPKKHIAFAKKRVFLDIGEGEVFQLARLYPKRPSGGFGFLFSIKALLEWFKKQV